MVVDFQTVDLTPAGTNRAGRIVKNMRIAGSGIYTYGRWELPSLGIALDSIPEAYADKYVFNVFRPPEVLKSKADMFARQPITIGHPDEYVTTRNAQKYQHGLTGDTVVAELDPTDEELYLYTSGTITTDQGLAAYDEMGELSCGYDPVIKWQSGKHKGTDYQLVMTDLNDGNHVAIVPSARGGEKCTFMDSSSLFIEAAKRLPSKLNGGNMAWLDGLKTKLGFPAGDSVDKAKLLIATLADGADPAVTIKAVEGMITSLPACDGKTKLLSHLTELSNAKGIDKAVMTEAVSIVNGLIDEVRNFKHANQPTADANNATVLAALTANTEVLTKMTATMDELSSAVSELKATATEDYQPGTTGTTGDEGGEEPPAAAEDQETEEQKKEREAKEKADAEAAAATDSGSEGEKPGQMTAAISPTSDAKTGQLTSDSFMAKITGRC